MHAYKNFVTVLLQVSLSADKPQSYASLKLESCVGLDLRSTPASISKFANSTLYSYSLCKHKHLMLCSNAG